MLPVLLLLVFLALAQPSVGGELRNARNLSSYADGTGVHRGLDGRALALAPDLSFDCAGRVTRWDALVERQFLYTLRFSVWRSFENGADCYELVGTNDKTVNVNSTRLVRLDVELEHQIEVEPGDIVGVYAFSHFSQSGNVEIDETAEDLVTYFKEQADLNEYEFCILDASGDVQEIIGLPLITASVETTEGTTTYTATSMATTVTVTTQEPTTPSQNETATTIPPTTTNETPATTATTSIQNATTTGTFMEIISPTASVQNATLIGGILREAFISALTVSSVVLLAVVVVAAVILGRVWRRCSQQDTVKVATTNTDIPTRDSNIYSDVFRANTLDKQRTDGIYTELDLASPQSKEHNYENVTADPGYLNVLNDPGSATSATDYEVPVATIDGRYTLSTHGVYEVPVDAKKEEESIEIVYASPKVPTGVLNALQTEAESSDYYTPIQAPSSGDGYVTMASVTVDTYAES